MATEDEGAATGVEEGADEALNGAEGGHEETDQGTDAGSEASDEDRLAESLASELGWSPKDRWRGSEADWKPARDFLKTTVEVNKARGREIKDLNQRVERIARTSAQMADRAAAEERSRWENKHREAVEVGDAEAALQASRQIDRLSAPPEPDAPVKEFAERNATWFNVDPIATQMAFNVAQMHADRGADAATQVAEAEKVIRKRFPELFEDDPARPAVKVPQVASPSSRSSAPVSRGPKGYNDLPAEAKTAALDFEKRGRASKEDYAKVYWQENA